MQRYECSQCTKISRNEQAAEQHNRDMHGNCATVSPMRSRSDLIADIARLKRNGEHLHNTIEKLVTAGARLTAELAEARAALGLAYETAANECATADSLELALVGTGGLMVRILELDPIATAALEADRKRVREDETRACAEVCDKQAETFSTEEYAVGQPLASFAERLACSQIKAAILARLDQPKAEDRT